MRILFPWRRLSGKMNRRKKSLWLVSFFREIGRSPARFLSIAAISFIAVAFFAGVRAAAPDMRLSADAYLDSTDAADLSLLSASGFTADDVRAIEQTPGVEAVMAGVSQDVMMGWGDSLQANIKLISMPLSIQEDIWTEKPALMNLDRYKYDDQARWLGKPVVTQGRLPENRNEIALDSRFAAQQGIQVGTRVTCTTSSGTLEMSVSGLVDSPYYIGLERGSSRIGTGASDGFAYAMGDDIAALATRMPLATLLNTTYTQVWVKAEGVTELNSFSDGYEAALEPLEERLEALGEDRAGEDEWYVLDRGGFSTDIDSYGQDAERVAAIGLVFPILFFVVAILVSLTTMTRMVEEQRTQMGTYKALGYSSASIAGQYMAYAIVAAASGAILGLCLGFWLFPTIIMSVYGIMYTVPEALTPFHGTLALQSMMAVLLCVVGGTWAACGAAMHAPPAVLMRPKSPPMGKRVLLERIKPLWRRLSFHGKVTARNLFRYKKRFLMSVLGIAGSCALILTGFGLRDSITLSLEGQFDQIWQMDAMINLSKSMAEADFREMCEPLITPERFNQWVTGYQQLSDVENAARPEDDGVADCYVTAVGRGQEQAFYQMVEMLSPRGQPVSLDASGVVITEKLARLAGLSVGDQITFTLSGKSCQAQVTGIVRNYVYHYVYMTQDLYEALTGEQMPFSMVYATLQDDSAAGREEAATALYANPRIASVNFVYDIRDQLDGMLASIDSVVIVLVVSSAALAYVVLYNLTNINILERSRELATLRVLGFNDQEMYSYIFRENYLITAIGILFGLGLGAVLHSFVITTCEVDIMLFIKKAQPISFAYAAAMTAVFSVIVNATMRRRIRSVDMVESLKSIE